MLALTDTGASSSNATRRVSVSVPPNRLEAKAWSKYLMGDIQWIHLIHLSIDGSGTNPPEHERNMMTTPDPAKKVRSCDQRAMEWKRMREFPTIPDRANDVNRVKKELQVGIEGLNRLIIGIPMYACTKAQRMTSQVSRKN